MANDLPIDAVSLVDLARERGVSSAAIRKRVLKMEASGSLTGYIGPGGAKYVSRSAFDFAVGANGDPAKEAAAESSALMRGGEAPVISTPDTEGPAYRDAKARQAYYDAELKRLTYERESGQLYRVQEVDAAMVRLAGVVTSVAKGIVSRADDGAAALDQGMPSFRRWLVTLGEDICRALAAEWRVLAEETSASPEQSMEPPVVSDDDTGD